MEQFLKWLSTQVTVVELNSLFESLDDSQLQGVQCTIFDIFQFQQKEHNVTTRS